MILNFTWHLTDQVQAITNLRQSMLRWKRLFKIKRINLTTITAPLVLLKQERKPMTSNILIKLQAIELLKKMPKWKPYMQQQRTSTKRKLQVWHKHKRMLLISRTKHFMIKLKLEQNSIRWRQKQPWRIATTTRKQTASSTASSAQSYQVWWSCMEHATGAKLIKRIHSKAVKMRIYTNRLLKMKKEWRSEKK